jgi:hypothetical protein
MIRILVLVAVIAAFLVLVEIRRGKQTSHIDNATAPIGSLEADQQTLRALRDAGADLTKPTQVNFYLYFSDRVKADAAAAEATTRELPASVKRGADDSSWLCLVSGRMVPTESAIRQVSTRLQAVATTHGGEYDGWEAAVTK